MKEYTAYLRNDHKMHYGKITVYDEGLNLVFSADTDDFRAIDLFNSAKDDFDVCKVVEYLKTKLPSADYSLKIKKEETIRRRSKMNYNFEKVENTVSRRKGNFIRFFRDGFSFSAEAAEALGHPRYVNAYLDRTEKVIAFVATNDETAYTFSKADKGGVVNNRTLAAKAREVLSIGNGSVRLEAKAEIIDGEVWLIAG